MYGTSGEGGNDKIDHSTGYFKYDNNYYIFDSIASHEEAQRGIFGPFKNKKELVNCIRSWFKYDYEGIKSKWLYYYFDGNPVAGMNWNKYKSVFK